VTINHLNDNTEDTIQIPMMIVEKDQGMIAEITQDIQAAI
jgi:hypothetical protein